MEELNLKVESLRTYVKQLTGTYEEEEESAKEEEMQEDKAEEVPDRPDK